MSYKMAFYTLINKDDDDAIVSTGLLWEEVIALVDRLGLDNWDVIEHIEEV